MSLKDGYNMKHTYTSKYEVIQTFKVTDQQEIYIGMELGEDGIPVVINHVKNPSCVNSFEDS